MMKKLIVLSGIVLALTAACSNGGAEGEGAGGGALDGTWKIVKAEGTMADVNIGTEYIFDGDKMTLKGGGIKTPGTFKTDKDSIIFSMDGYPDPMKYTQSMKGEQLVLKVVGSDQVFYLDKE